ncbi:hypothetical protein [Arthrobacter sp. Br18]|uniref:hypothetical protein n=1 Tax=Arthrobacter sp. Br18 TaxID=1312954 RepID=UPI001C1DDDC1|nr:hypothetical protein [Arthrobacter sp. Br18]
MPTSPIVNLDIDSPQLLTQDRRQPFRLLELRKQFRGKPCELLQLRVDEIRLRLRNGITAREAKLPVRETEVGNADAAVKTAEAQVAKREEAVNVAQTTKAAHTVGDGTWTVGTDIEPGTYRTRPTSDPPATGDLRDRQQRQQHHRQRPSRRAGLQVRRLRQMGEAVGVPRLSCFQGPGASAGATT